MLDDTGSASPTKPHGGSLHRRVLATLVAAALGLAGAELVTRAFARFGGELGAELARFDPLRARFAPHGDFGYREWPNHPYPFGNGTVAYSNSMAYRGPEVAWEKPADAYRIVLLGESTTHGFGVEDDQTIDAFMRAELAARHPGRRFEVVNLALGGYDAYQIFERMRTDGVRLRPDLVIVNSGINDVRNAQFPDLEIPGPDRRTLIWEDDLARLRADLKRGGPGAWTRIRHHLFLARLPGFARAQMQTKEAVARLRSVEPYPDAVEYFAYYVERTADLADEIAADLVLSTPASALAHYDPRSMSFRGYWIIDAETTEAYRRLLARRMREIAQARSRRGRRVPYLSHDLPPDHFLDDCHLTAEGNRAVARRFVEAAAPFIAETLRERAAVAPPPAKRS